MLVDKRSNGEPLYVRNYSNQMLESIVDHEVDVANTDRLWVVCCNHGYYVDEEGGASLWTKRKKHALRMDRQSADEIARYPSLASQRPLVEAA